MLPHSARRFILGPSLPVAFSMLLAACSVAVENRSQSSGHYVRANNGMVVSVGGHASRIGRDALERARSLLRQTQEPPVATRQIEDSPGDTEPAGSNHICPVCHVGRMTVVADLTPQRQPPTRLRAPPEGAA